MISCGSREEVVFMLHVKRRLRGFTGSGSPFEDVTGAVITGLETGRHRVNNSHQTLPTTVISQQSNTDGASVWR